MMARPVEYGGRRFASVTEAAKAHGCSPTSMSRALDGKQRLGAERGLPVRVGEREWPSLAAMAADLGVSRQAVSKANKEGRLEAMVVRWTGGRA